MLVVDDEPSIRQLLESALVDAGVAVTTARDGIEAIERARADRPSVVLLDLMLPRLDGVEVARRLRADPLTASVYVVAMTASGRFGAAAMEAGADAFVAKPFDLDQVLEQVAAAMRRPRLLERRRRG